jgi:hypothetical protein
VHLVPQDTAQLAATHIGPSSHVRKAGRFVTTGELVYGDLGFFGSITLVLCIVFIAAS